MSSDRTTAQGRPVIKPTLASTRTARTPLAPRLAASNTPTTLPAPTRRTPIPRSEPPSTSTPRPRAARPEDTPTKDVAGTLNITPRSSARKSRVESANSTPSQAGDSPSLLRPRVSGNASSTVSNGERNGTAGLSAGYASQGRAAANRPKSLISESGSLRSHAPAIRSPGYSDPASPPADESIDSRFFHASDVSRPEPAPKRSTVTKTAPTFFYADGRQDERTGSSSRAPSPVLSAVSEQRSIGPWAKTDAIANPTRSTPLLSPNLATLPASSPFFAAPPKGLKSRSPSPSKENIHLSYRKGASQIFGSRPTQSPQNPPSRPLSEAEPRRLSSETKFFQTPHRKTPSLSSIDSTSTHPSRRRSATTLEPTPTAPSPLSLESKSLTYPKLSRPPSNLPSISTPTSPTSTSRRSSITINPAPGNPISSPTKPPTTLAADARRERKVLDLEISNSSLLAINSSLEREVRRQKAELKRFRRLSRAGRFSLNPVERAARFSEGLSVLGEEGEEGGSDLEDGVGEREGEGEYGEFGPPSGFTEVYDDFSSNSSNSSNDDDEGNDEPLSPTAQDLKQKERLAKDEKRLRVDLEKHKELLVQSQMMNQSLKRCTCAAEGMIRDGRKALDYKVRVADIKLGGRILTGEEDVDGGDAAHGGEVEIEVDDNLADDTVGGVDGLARGFLDLWQGLGGNTNRGPRLSSASGFESSEGGDRDSGIEVEKSVRFGMPGGGGGFRIPGLEEGRPPDGVGGGVGGRPGVHWTNTIS